MMKKALISLSIMFFINICMSNAQKLSHHYVPSGNSCCIQHCDPCGAIYMGDKYRCSISLGNSLSVIRNSEFVDIVSVTVPVLVSQQMGQPPVVQSLEIAYCSTPCTSVVGQLPNYPSYVESIQIVVLSSDGSSYTRMIDLP